MKGTVTLEKYYELLVREDSPQAWAKLMEKMPWGWAPSDEERRLFKKLDLEQLDIDTSDPSEVGEELQNSEDGVIFGEYFVEPMLAINDDFFPCIKSCYQMFPLTKGSTPSVDDLGSLYRAKHAIVAENFSPISFLVIVCPRCQLRFTEGDEEVDFSPEDCVFEDCIACAGSGEWEYELLP